MTISGPEHAVEKAAEYVMSVIAGTYDINQAVVRMTALDNSSGAYFNAQAQQFGNMQQQQAWAASQYSHWPNEQAIAQAAYQQAMADMAAGKIRQAAPPAAAAGGGTTSAGSTTVAAPVMDPATLKQWKDYIGQCDRAIADAPQEKRKEMKDYVDNLKRQYGLTDALLRDDGDEAEAKEQAAVDRRLAGVDKSTPAAVTAEKPTE
ncbi:hypothetical protein Pmar_PMAR029162 [Perkinsus marinus ATCC 50983]|uniref:Uncharacterized protein n=1 Tax=Perkinsus marinus (strain ATCC 50983 / TXsc) TaxID=423536 RepID=C5M0T1_PERM5|nr:hypothetical protein Pmar_PMAR029162 [Perkinsus marinus ATCC 50983]EEQ97439.1 hypothetical protein Pmar_PMAR029162 [Perkinsus marinus ATCC 50983]|eukprot:XP_002764722.1 hypothetical protein Pmar_PMAR029162 [Perkinsus marinus ATCC 50983]